MLRKIAIRFKTELRKPAMLKALGELIYKVNYKTESLKAYKFIKTVSPKNCKNTKNLLKWKTYFHAVIFNDGQITDSFAKHFVLKQRKQNCLKQREKVFEKSEIFWLKPRVTRLQNYAMLSLQYE